MRNGVDIVESEVRATFKRLDIDRDARVTFSEFKRIFSSSLPTSSANLSNSFYKGTFYDSKANNKSFTETFRGTNRTSFSPVSSPVRSTLRSPLRTSLNKIYSPNRFSSPLRDRTLSVLEMSNERMNRSTLRSLEPVARSTFSASSSSGFKTIGSGAANLNANASASAYISFEEENFINYYKELLELENQIEKAKCEVIIKADFNTEDAFSIFELDRRGFINDLDIKYGLNSLDIFPTQEEILLLIKRYDTRGEGILTYFIFYILFLF